MAWRSSHLTPDGKVPQGYWGPITSSLLWCEDKYRWSKYIAEPVNTFTNLGFVALSLYGARGCALQGLPRRFVLTNLGIALVGLGSFAFHATLTRPAQLLDELPMIYASLILSYCVLETSKLNSSKPTGGLFLPFILAFVGLFVTVGYLALPYPILHQVAYATIQLATTIKVISLLWSSNSPLNQSTAARINRSMARKSYGFGAAVFLTGFAIWNIDNAFCNTLRVLRAQVGSPFKVLLEGHGWWHILTGYGAYHLVQSSALIAMSVKDDAGKWTFREFDTLKGFLLPQVVRVDQHKHNKRS
ncbi:unnamed protein product [Sympodiomycopsis kandeliae]